MPAEPTVYVVDDEPEICNLLREAFEIVGLRVKTYSCGQDFLDDYRLHSPGCLLLDLGLPEMSGLQIQAILAEQGNKTPVIFLTGSGDVSSAVEALKAGAADYIQKPPRLDELLSRVRNAMDLDLRARHERMQGSDVEHRISLLTPREREVMNWIVKGKSNKMIARILEISSRTVEIHRKNVIVKMQAQSTIDLVKMILE